MCSKGLMLARQDDSCNASTGWRLVTSFMRDNATVSLARPDDTRMHGQRQSRHPPHTRDQCRLLCKSEAPASQGDDARGQHVRVACPVFAT